MKRIQFLPLAIIIGLCLQSPALLAQDTTPDKKDAKDAADSGKGDKGVVHDTKDIQGGAQPAMASQDDKSYGKVSDKATQEAAPQDDRSSRATSDNSLGSALRAKDSGLLNSDAMVPATKQKESSQTSERSTSALVVQGNQANHYNGRWFAASSHSDWDQGTDHQWNNHDYRWYDGGWLIIDMTDAPGYSANGSVGANVQASLAQQGYYNGPIDGDIGRGTRRAISHYESDNGLPINGEIDEPLLVSLRLQ
jgi:hypothetical protein